MAKILVVDDDLMMRIIFKHTFEDHDVLLAEDGREAIALVEWESPDLILMDIVMPGLDGITTGQIIAKRHSIPIIFLSSSAEDAVMPIDLASCEVISKPFDPIKLRHKVSDLLIAHSLLKIPQHPVLQARAYG